MSIFIGKKAKSACVAVLFAAATGAAHADEMRVQIDQTAPVKLPRAAASVVIGNPAIADVMAQTSDLFFVIGRTHGTTNVVAVDANGDTITNMVVHVNSTDSKNLFLHRSASRLTYSCAPKCERSLMPGDAPEPYENLGKEFENKIRLAESGKQASGAGD